MIPAEQLDAELEGGLYPYTFDHETYWTQICAHGGVRGDGRRFIPERKGLQQDQVVLNGKANSEASERAQEVEQEQTDRGGSRLEEVLSGPAYAGEHDENGKINGHDVHIVAGTEGTYPSLLFVLHRGRFRYGREWFSTTLRNPPNNEGGHRCRFQSFLRFCGASS